MSTTLGVDALLQFNILDALAVWLTAMGKLERAVRAFGSLEGIYRRFEPCFLAHKCNEHEAELAAVR
jgi:hypothetical protein